MGLEPTTFGTTIRRSNQLSYTHHLSFLLLEFLTPFSETHGKGTKSFLLYKRFARQQRSKAE